MYADAVKKTGLYNIENYNCRIILLKARIDLEPHDQFNAKHLSSFSRII